MAEGMWYTFGIFCSCNYFFICCIRLSITDIVFYCTCKQIDILLYNSYVSSKTLLRHLSNIHTININFS